MITKTLISKWVIAKPRCMENTASQITYFRIKSTFILIFVRINQKIELKLTPIKFSIEVHNEILNTLTFHYIRNL